MAASRAARKREMIANLENEEYLNDLANESLTDIASYSRELRKGKVSEVIIHRRNFPADSAISR